MSGHRPLVALIHATPAAMAPAAAAFADAFPAVRLWNLLDDTLVADAERAGGLTAALRTRMRTLIGYAIDGGADAVVLSCSMFGPVAAEQYDVPVLSSDAALFDAVARLAPGRATVLGPFPAATEDTVARLRAHLGHSTTVSGVVVAGVREALASGQPARAGELIAAAATDAGHADVLVLGQFSLAPARDEAQAALPIPVFSSPHLAAQALRARLGGDATP
ncbi:aspartate/glutamate racemase family protein [Prauserella cavernicola]|uniref:Asp/Glu racemase n=1 Tax=Prauserella cavernicola TaxID=2800127 RepID=A0A934QQ13_9PSEU|nr:aspartate/glutamate racemase family protein [Prauserella cavernicola]MBK1783963.1 hypothetical protein [Prauserella cavernicola]